MDILCETELFPNISKTTELSQFFSPCLIFGLLPLLPLLLIFLSLIFNGISSRIYVFSPISINSKITRAKLSVSFVSLMCSLINSVVFNVFNAGQLKERRAFEVGDCVFNLFGLITYYVCLRLGFATSGFLHVSWLLRFATLIPIVISIFNDLLNSHNLFFGFTAIVTLLELLTAAVLVVLFCLPDGDGNDSYERLEDKPKCPFDHSSAFQNALYSYAGPLLKRGFREKVDINEFWQVDQRYDAVYLRKYTDQYQNSTLTLWSLFWLLLRCSWTKELASFLHCLLCIGTRLSYALLFASLLEVVSGEYPWYLAFAPAVGLIATDVVKSLSWMQMTFKGTLAFYTVQSTIASLIFDKMMRLSPSAQTITGTGVISNYITVDVMHCRQFWCELYEFIYCPAILTISLVGLSLIVGIRNTCYGVSILFVFQLVGLCMSKFSSRFTGKQMKHKDERMKLVNDLLNGIRIIKLYAYEVPMQKITAAIRKREIREIFKSQLIDSVIEASFRAMPLLATIITFYFFVVVDGNKLNPSSAFLTIFFFDLLRYATFKLPRLSLTVMNTLLSLRRILKFLQLEERPRRCIKSFTQIDEFTVQMSNASFSWTNSLESKNLSNVTVNIRPGQLVAVIGSVGSGKSTLLSAIAGELEAVDGECVIRANCMTYVPQQAWIQNMTLRDNVVFDSNFDVDHYEKTLDACCLRDDIELLPSGDLTEIGEKGINLSGGQKARVSLARSVYCRVEFYVLDNPFSAVDANVGQRIFRNVVGPDGCLKNTTRIVALNSTAFLDQFDLIISLENGKMVFCGPYSQLRDSSPIKHSILAVPEKTTEDSDDKLEGNKQLVDVKYAKDKLIESESSRTGVTSEMYVDYIRAFGPLLFAIFVLCLLVGYTVTRMSAGLFIANWSSEGENLTRAEAMHKLVVYGSFNVGADILFVIAYIILAIGVYRASVIFHHDLLQSILRAPMSFYEKTPIGRTINRFSTDIEILDTSLYLSFGFTFMLIAETIAMLLNVFGALPILIPAVLPLLVLLFFVTRYFNAASVQFRRISSNSMSHVCSAVQDAYSGASSIRVYGCLDRFREDFGRRLNQTIEANTVELISRLWVQIRMAFGAEITVLVFLLVATYFAACEWISLGMLGLIVNSCIMLCTLFGYLAQVYRDAETRIVCVERLKEYTTLEAEEIWKQSARKSPANSSVEFRNISLRYREQDDPVLHDVSFRVEQGERIGIVGRTGAGKTSILSVLFRLVEPFEGEVLIGDVNIKDLGRTLRQILTIIPQDPVLFCGNLRSNLDPFGEYDDLKLWSALEKAHLSNFVHSLTAGLDHEIADGGSNLSAGQRQLVCLARALLRTTSILVLDEATAAVDLQTDALVQQTIRDHFAHCTVLTIAHRLHTILDYNRVLVMQSGRVREFDTPTALLAQSDGLFREFAQAAGIC